MGSCRELCQSGPPGMLVIHRDRKGAGDHQGTQYSRESHPPSGTPHFLPLLLRRISRRCVSGLTESQRQDPRNPYIVFGGPTMDFVSQKGPGCSQVLFSGFADASKGCRGEHGPPEALSVTEEVAGECVCPFHTNFLPHPPPTMVIPHLHSCLICLPVSILLSPRAEKGPGSHCVPLAFLV